MSENKTKEWLNILGLALTLIGGFVSILLIPNAEIKEYIISNSTWAFPLILLFAFLFLIWLGFILARFTWRKSSAKRSVKGAELTDVIDDNFIDVLDREKAASVIWIATRRLNHDINNPKYIEVIRNNIRKGAKYRYIVPDSEALKANIESYKELYQLTDWDIETMFLKIQHSDLIEFFRTITIYDPYENNTLAYFYGYTTDSRNNDYLIFDNNKSIEYVKLFKLIWYKYKDRLPIME